MKRTILRQSLSLSKATRLQLGNIKTDYGAVSTAAGSSEKWGFVFKTSRYPNFVLFSGLIYLWTFGSCVILYEQYRDMMISVEHVLYEDVRDRCLTRMPGWARLRTMKAMTPSGPMCYRDPTPLDWLPFELKLGTVKHASY